MQQKKEAAWSSCWRRRRLRTSWRPPRSRPSSPPTWAETWGWGDRFKISTYLQFTKIDRLYRQKFCKHIVDLTFNKPCHEHSFIFSTLLSDCVACYVGCFQEAVWIQPISVTNQVGSVDCSLVDGWHFCSAANVPVLGGPMVYGLWIHYNQWPILVAALFVFWFSQKRWIAH